VGAQKLGRGAVSGSLFIASLGASAIAAFGVHMIASPGLYLRLGGGTAQVRKPGYYRFSGALMLALSLLVAGGIIFSLLSE